MSVPGPCCAFGFWQRLSGPASWSVCAGCGLSQRPLLPLQTRSCAAPRLYLAGAAPTRDLASASGLSAPPVAECLLGPQLPTPTPDHPQMRTAVPGGGCLHKQRTLPSKVDSACHPSLFSCRSLAMSGFDNLNSGFYQTSYSIDEQSQQSYDYGGGGGPHGKQYAGCDCSQQGRFVPPDMMQPQQTYTGQIYQPTEAYPPTTPQPAILWRQL